MAELSAARAAAEKVERGVERYAAGDWAAARREFEEALQLEPGHAQATRYLGWVRDLQDGKRSLDPKKKALDDDALRELTSALDEEVAPREPATTQQGMAPLAAAVDAIAEEKMAAPTKPSSAPTVPQLQATQDFPPPIASAPPPDLNAPPSMATPPASRPTVVSDFGRAPLGGEVASAPPSELDAGWDPVPLTPSGHHEMPISSAPPPRPPSNPRVPKPGTDPRVPKPRSEPRIPRPENDPRVEQPSEPAPRRPTSSTLLGIPPATFDRPRLTPASRPSVMHEERLESVTREWHAVPTGTNLPPLDVPELTEQQVTELLALDTPLYSSRGGGNTSVDLLPADDDEPRLVELEAEPTPPPHRSPLVEPAGSSTATDPSLKLPPPQSEFDSFDQTPTRDRSEQLRLVHGARDDDSSATNPFITSKLLEYASPHVDDLPPPPPPSGTPPEVAALEAALGDGDAHHALELAERLTDAAGGLDAEPCRALHALLDQTYLLALGGLERRPTHGQVTPDLDPRSAFLLSRLDGSLTFEDLLDVSGMPRLHALRTLALLVGRGVVIVS